MILPLRDLERVKDRYREQGDWRRALSTQAQLVQTVAKRAIFAIHRDEPASALELLIEAKDAEQKAREICEREPSLTDEGVWRAAQEELLEAELLVSIVTGDHVINLPIDDPARVIGACADVVGELARVIVRDVTKGRLDRVAEIQSVAQEVLSFLLTFDATGYARQKVDQARQHVRKIEDVAYDLAIRGARYE